MTKSEVHYIGLSAQEFVEHAQADLKSMDDGRVPDDFRKAYAGLVNSLGNQKARWAHYFFVYSRFIILKLEF